MAQSKLTSKFQATIPLEIRKVLKLKAGDRVVFKLKKDKSVEIKKASKTDQAYLKAIGYTLSEWEDAQDEAAFKNL